MSDDEDLTAVDDTALLDMRAQMRAELERLPPGSPGHAALTTRYDRSTAEVDARARTAWARSIKEASTKEEPAKGATP